MNDDSTSGGTWLESALAQAPERGRIEVAGAPIETLAWGEPGRPGLLLLHGAGGHADWWAPVAPLLARDYRTVAFSLSGMGRSGWRERYSMDLFAEEAFAVAQAAGLFAAGPPLVAAHSFGGQVALHCAAGARAGELKGVVLVDTLIRPPEMVADARPFSARNQKTYPSREAILARFRLMPAQPSDPRLFDYVAGHAIRERDDGTGWSWRFDAALWDKLERASAAADLRAVRCPLAAIQGGASALMTPEITAFFRQQAPPGTPVVVVPEAHHHLMLDRPLALVDALRGLFAGWPPKE